MTITLTRHTSMPWVFEDAFIRAGEDRHIICAPPSDPENARNWPNDAAFIVMACSSHNAMAKALKDILVDVRSMVERRIIPDIWQDPIYVRARKALAASGVHPNLEART